MNGSIKNNNKAYKITRYIPIVKNIVYVVIAIFFISTLVYSFFIDGYYSSPYIMLEKTESTSDLSLIKIIPYPQKNFIIIYDQTSNNLSICDYNKRIFLGKAYYKFYGYAGLLTYNKLGNYYILDQEEVISTRLYPTLVYGIILPENKESIRVK